MMLEQEHTEPPLLFIRLFTACGATCSYSYYDELDCYATTSSANFIVADWANLIHSLTESDLVTVRDYLMHMSGMQAVVSYQIHCTFDKACITHLSLTCIYAC